MTSDHFSLGACFTCPHRVIRLLKEWVTARWGFSLTDISCGCREPDPPHGTWAPHEGKAKSVEIKLWAASTIFFSPRLTLGTEPKEDNCPWWGLTICSAISTCQSAPALRGSVGSPRASVEYLNKKKINKNVIATFVNSTKTIDFSFRRYSGDLCLRQKTQYLY